MQKHIPYSQWRAMLAITRASLKSITRSPSAVVFSFAFPFVFILVFGFIGKTGGMRRYEVMMDPGSDTENIFYRAIAAHPELRVMKFPLADDVKLAEQKGELAGIIKITKGDAANPYKVSLKTTSASDDKWPQVVTVLRDLNNRISDSVYRDRRQFADFKFDAATDRTAVREYKTIDFILPGQLGFSLLSAAVFGVAFMFFNLRNTLVLKRFFATPIGKPYIILGEALSRVIFQLITAVVIILAGHFFFGFTLVHGVRTLFDMLVLSTIALLVFMGFGFIVSGVAKSDSSIPPFANLITMPQFLLAGTFFSIDVFPKWLQPIARAMPLTYLNDAMRSVAFEGHSLWDVRYKIVALLLWGIGAYLLASKLFKWE